MCRRRVSAVVPARSAVSLSSTARSSSVRSTGLSAATKAKKDRPSSTWTQVSVDKDKDKDPEDGCMVATLLEWLAPGRWRRGGDQAGLTQTAAGPAATTVAVRGAFRNGPSSPIAAG